MAGPPSIFLPQKAVIFSYFCLNVVFYHGFKNRTSVFSLSSPRAFFVAFAPPG